MSGVTQLTMKDYAPGGVYYNPAAYRRDFSRMAPFIKGAVTPDQAYAAGIPKGSMVSDADVLQAGGYTPNPNPTYSKNAMTDGGGLSALGYTLNTPAAPTGGTGNAGSTAQALGAGMDDPLKKRYETTSKILLGR